MVQRLYPREWIRTASQTFTFKLVVVLGLLTFGFSTVVGAAQVSNSVTLKVAQSDNIRSAFGAADDVSDTSLDASYQRNYRKPIGLSVALFYGVSLAARDYLDYPRSRANLSAQFGVDKKLGIGFYKPRLRLAWRGSRVFYQSSGQNTLNSRLSIAASRPLTETVNVALELAHEWQIPDNDFNGLNFDDESDALPASALNRSWTEIILSSEVFLDSYWSLPISISHARGDLESLSSEREPALRRANAIILERNLGATPYLYRYEGKVWATSVSANRLLENGSSINLGINYSSVSADRGGSYDQSSFSIAWTKSW